MSTSIRAAAPSAELIRTLSTGGGIAVKTIDGAPLLADALALRTMAPTAANALGRLMMGTVMIAAEAGETDVETVQIQLRGSGPLGSLVAISDSAGRVRGTVRHPDVSLSASDGSPDVARAIGLGTLNVMRNRAEWKRPYTGTVPLTSGEIAEDLTLYLSESEQIPSAMGLGVAMTPDRASIAAAGFLVQIGPDADEDEIARVEANVRALPRLTDLILAGEGCPELLDRLLDGVGSRARHTSHPRFHCPCTRERARLSLRLLGRDELREIVGAGLSQEVCCEFCSRAYVFEPDEIGAVLPDA